MRVASDSHASARKGESPLRTCVVTRSQLAPEDLIRFVLDPQGIVVADLGNRLPGRGVWVICDKASVATAVKIKAFSRGLKQHAQAPADLADIVERQLLRRVCEALSLANTAGLVVTGHDKVEQQIAAGTPVALLHGHDASHDGINRLNRQYNAMSRDARRPARIVLDLSIEQMSLALGRSNVVHAALKTGGVAGFFLSEVGRFQRFTAGKPDTADSRAADNQADSPTA